MSNEPNPSSASEAEDESLRIFWRGVKRHPIYRMWQQPARLVKNFVPYTWRYATHYARHLPTAVIVGANKAGTTQLYSYLTTHPRCFGAAIKEVNYFSKYPHRSVGWYRSKFPVVYRVSRKEGHVMEASPSYLSRPSALRQMKKVLPRARVIVLLRDPVSRAFSHYQHEKTRHRESRSFQQCVEEELAATTFTAEFGVATRPNAREMCGYVSRGYYALQLELLLSLYSRNKVLIVDSADLFKDTNGACDRVFNFLGLEIFDVQPTKIYNRGFYKEKIDPNAAAQLREHYRPYDRMLEELIGQRFSWMPQNVASQSRAA